LRVLLRFMKPDQPTNLHAGAAGSGSDGPGRGQTIAQGLSPPPASALGQALTHKCEVSCNMLRYVRGRWEVWGGGEICIYERNMYICEIITSLRVFYGTFVHALCMHIWVCVSLFSGRLWRRRLLPCRRRLRRRRRVPRDSGPSSSHAGGLVPDVRGCGRVRRRFRGCPQGISYWSEFLRVYLLPR
jgi:hypothetical protein